MQLVVTTITCIIMEIDLSCYRLMENLHSNLQKMLELYVPDQGCFSDSWRSYNQYGTSTLNQVTYVFSTSRHSSTYAAGKANNLHFTVSNSTYTMQGIINARTIIIRKLANLKKSSFFALKLYLRQVAKFPKAYRCIQTSLKLFKVLL